eukprot:327834_1
MWSRFVRQFSYRWRGCQWKSGMHPKPRSLRCSQQEPFSKFNGTYPVALAVTIPFVSIIDEQGQRRQVEIPDSIVWCSLLLLPMAYLSYMYRNEMEITQDHTHDSEKKLVEDANTETKERIAQLEQRIAQLETKERIANAASQEAMPITISSSILKETETSTLASLLQQSGKGLSHKRWSLLYRGSRDGFRANVFHNKCD